MADLTGKKVSNTYKDLLKVQSSVDNAGIDSTKRFISDGAGNNTAIKLSDSAVGISGNVSVNGALKVTGAISAGTLNIASLSVTNLDATSITSEYIRASVVSATAFYGDGSNLTGVVVTAAASAGTSATLETRIAGVSSGLQTNINTVSAGLDTANTSIAANASAVVALSATLESRIAAVSAAIPTALTSLQNTYWETTTSPPTSSGGRPEGYVWYVIS